MENQKRKLAAIVFTDIVGFTKLSSENEPVALQILETQRELLKPIVESHNGEWLKEIGDGLLLSFGTIHDAVDCSIAIQNAVKDVENLILRIGIHQGEVVFQGSDVVGDDVNIASRIEPFSAPGGIAISGRVNASLERHPEYETVYLGKPKLKGVSQEVKAYCIVSHGLPKTDLSQVTAKLEKKSKIWYLIFPAIMAVGIAVYLFIPKSESVVSVAIMYMEIRGDEEDNYLEAITEDLIFDLASAVPGRLKVSESASVKKYKNTDLEIADLAKSLGVQYIFKSSLQSYGDGYNLRCRLVEAKTGTDKFLKKWFIEGNSLQSIVGVLAENIITGLDIAMAGELKKIEYNPEAYQLYLKAKDLYARSDNYEKDLEAIDLMKDVIILDDKLIAAQLKLGVMYYENGEYEEAGKLYEQSLNKSKRLEDNTNIAESLRKQGQLFRKQRQNEMALEKFNEALSISTVMNDKNSMAKTMNSIAILYYITERLDEALEYWLQAFTIAKEFDDKLKISKYLNNIGIWYWKDFDYSKAIDYYNQSLVIKEELGDTRNYGKTLNNLGEVYYDMGDYTKSIDYFNQSILMKEKLNDNKGLNSTLFNLAEAQIYNTNYQDALGTFKRSLTISNTFGDIFQISERYLGIGMTYFNLTNYDSASYYLGKADSIFLELPVERLSTLSWLAITSMKDAQNVSAQNYIKMFDELFEQIDPKRADIISINWNMYQVHELAGDKKSAKEYLENAYLEMKSHSKMIKNKADRKQYLSVKLHKDILAHWDK